MNIVNLKAITARLGQCTNSEWQTIMECVNALLNTVATISVEHKKPIPAVVQVYGGTSHKRSEDGDGTKSESINITEIMGSFTIEKLNSEKGEKAKGSAWNPLDFETFKKRSQNFQSTARAAKYKSSGKFKFTEDEIFVMTELFCQKYNEKFGTNFEPYHSERRWSIKRDGPKPQ